ncbi:lanthionine synthetase C family protein [Nonomuraea sp. NPDC050451]|uniref:lanthionine synthetase C family protein n=1 Tax=Nonomuraea sp. NPDC050451 TaxID=3364364 RepID=UPI0037B97E8F
MPEDRFLPPSLAAEARRVAWTIVNRLDDDDAVHQAVRRTANVAGVAPDWWGGAKLYGGNAGHALMLRYASRVARTSADRWRDRSRDILLRAISSTSERPPAHGGLGEGTAGLALVLDEFAADQPGYLRVRRQADRGLLQQVARASRGGSAVDPAAYDVVTGSAGILGYLASATTLDVDARVTAAGLIDGLVRLYGSPPGPPLKTTETCPDRAVDLGLAHGLAGHLAALSLAWNAGLRRPGQRAAIRSLASYLRDVAEEDAWGRIWPRRTPIDDSLPDQLPHKPMTWCYGAPGICSALLDAARALDDPDLTAAAVMSFESALRRALHGDGEPRTVCLCHGWSGLLTICHKFAEHGGSQNARAALTPLTERVLSHCSDDQALIVRTVHVPGTYVDSPSLLDGAAGVPLALWSVSTSVPPRWRRALLIG